MTLENLNGLIFFFKSMQIILSFKLQKNFYKISNSNFINKLETGYNI